jgi:hypothetical protein
MIWRGEGENEESLPPFTPRFMIGRHYSDTEVEYVFNELKSVYPDGIGSIKGTRLAINKHASYETKQDPNFVVASLEYVEFPFN